MEHTVNYVYASVLLHHLAKAIVAAGQADAGRAGQYLDVHAAAEESATNIFRGCTR